MANAERNKTNIAPSVHYEAPRIELVVTEESMKREVHYAGAIASPGG